MKATSTMAMSDSEKLRRIEDLFRQPFSPAQKLLAVAFIVFPEETQMAAGKWLAALRKRERRSRRIKT